MTSTQIARAIRSCVVAWAVSATFIIIGNAASAEELTPLPPGAVRPAGWLKDWCVTAKNGYIGHLDEVDVQFPLAWTTNCMRRGEFLSWRHEQYGSWSAEGGAYWFDGLVRLAWQLDDPQLKAFAKRRLDTVLDRMNPNAITFVHWMDRRDPDQMKEMEAANEAWICWASAILGRAISGYYGATGDPRALRVLNWAFNDARFFEFGNGKPVPSAAWETYRIGRDPAVGAALDTWCAKGPDFNHIAWRYAKEPDKMEFRPFTQQQRDWRAQHGVLACETAISALRASFWRNGKREWGESVLKWSDYLRENCLQPYGVLVADESFGFTGPDRGTETCTVAASIRLNIEMLSLLGRGTYGDRVERAFFNAAPACTTADFRKHVYVQTANRTIVENRSDFTCPPVSRYYHKKHGPLCCTAALTRYIPDFVQHLWMKTSDGGLAATMYAPNDLAVEIDGAQVRIATETDYPFGEKLKLTIQSTKSLSFPLHLRIPAWCEDASVAVNGKQIAVRAADGFVTLRRKWSAGDVVMLDFPMKPFVTTGRDRNKGEPGKAWCAVSAGPLLFARNLEGTDENTLKAGVKTDWRIDPAAAVREAKLIRRQMPKEWRWSAEAMPIAMTVPTDAGALELVPYGSARLRVSMFGVNSVSDAARNDSEKMNATRVSAAEGEAGGVRVLFLGNSITLHGSLPEIGWTNEWGMAASAKEKDYAHLVARGIEQQTGRKAEIRIRNLADFERGFRTWNIEKELASDLDFDPDYLIIALGENALLETQDDCRDFCAAFDRLIRHFMRGEKRPKGVVRGVFWANGTKDAQMRRAAESNQLPFVAANIADLPGMMAKGLFWHRGVQNHPSDNGMAAIAQRILEALFPKKASAP